MSKRSIVIVIIAVVSAAGVVWKIDIPSVVRNETQVVAHTFEDCVAAGNAVMESYPRQCRTKEGDVFVEDVGNELQKSGHIRLDIPRPNAVIESPLIVTGEARGYWFFEADFPVRLYDANGEEIAIGIAQAQSSWMTEEFVAFRAELTFDQAPATEEGVLVLERSNPSGLPENDEELFVPIRFALAKEPELGVCRPTGCSGQLCADEEIITTCEFRPEYACFAGAVCERQPEGECGWTETSALVRCFGEALELKP